MTWCHATFLHHIFLAFISSVILLLPVLGKTQTISGNTTEKSDVTLALLRVGATWNCRPHALSRLAWEVRKRTSIAVHLTPVSVTPQSDDLFSYPLLMWMGETEVPPLPEDAVLRLRQHLSRGGTLFIDLSDGNPGGTFDRSVRRELSRVWPDASLARIPNDHVLYQSFFLLDRHGGRVPAKPYLEGIFIDNRLAVVLSSNDLAGALSRDEFGQWQFDLGPGESVTREVSFRLAINLLMYALCLDYKGDQVHIPFILQRRR